MSKKYILGVDGGGTKTHYALYDLEGNLVELVKGTAANHEKYENGYEVVKGLIDEVVNILLDNQNATMDDIVYAVFGLAGADVKRQYKELEKVISDIGIRKFEVYNDAFLGVKAGSKKGYGICSINGTGTSCVAVNKTGEWLQIGGTGFIFGDEAGSGHIADLLIRRVYDFLYRKGKNTVMKEKLFNAFDITKDDELVEAVYEKGYTGIVDLPYLNRIVFEAANEGDEVAIELLEFVGKQCASSVIGAVDRLDFGEETIDVIMAGSIYLKGENPVLNDTFKTTVQEATDKDINFILLDVPPVIGAVTWALEKELGRYDSSIRENVIKTYYDKFGR